jgi:endonuclease/exonuclease/phosphatase family metal-dependent hydrolase
MKIISLNTWGGVAGLDGLLDFFRRHADVDIFCLQEVWHGGAHMRGSVAGGKRLENFIPELYAEIGNALPYHVGYFRPHFHEWYGLAIFVKKDLEVKEEGEIFVYKNRGFISDKDAGNHARNLQYIILRTAKGMRAIVNFHGLWNGMGKSDTEDRLSQSDNIVAFLRTLSRPSVLCGDFNLLPDTQSIKKIEDAGMRNLIKEFGITSTRSNFYKKPLRFADYTFVSSDIAVHDFKMLPDEISDHLAMYLDFE